MPHLAAIIGTYILVGVNFDWYYFVYIRSSQPLTALFSPAIFIGGIVPLVLPVLCIIFGMLVKNTKTVCIGWMLAQAMVLGSFISSAYKFFTGRIQPNTHDLVTNISHVFNFGFYEHGIFWGWPSSHTTIAFAMAVAVTQFFPRHRVTHVLVILYAFYIGIGVSFSIHWFSEFFAGMFIGSVIGVSVGRSFKEYFDTYSTENKKVV